MCLLVDDEVRALPEALPTLVAFVRFLSSMYPPVHDKVGALCEAPSTLVAHVLLLSGSSSVLGFGFFEDLLVSSMTDEFIPFRPRFALRGCLLPRALQNGSFPFCRCNSMPSPSLSPFSRQVWLFLRSSGSASCCGSQTRATSLFLEGKPRHGGGWWIKAQGEARAEPLRPQPQSLEGR